jgi:hypothetical protein
MAKLNNSEIGFLCVASHFNIIGNQDILVDSIQSVSVGLRY